MTQQEGLLPKQVDAQFIKAHMKNVQFVLLVDDFVEKYVGKENAQHLKNTLREKRTVMTEWKRTQYISITLDWDRKRRQVYLTVLDCVKKALKQFQHISQNISISPSQVQG